MPKNTSIYLDDHYAGFIAQLVAEGRFKSASEVVCAGLKLMEGYEQKLAALRALLEEGEQSGFVEFGLDDLLNNVDDDLHQ